MTWKPWTPVDDSGDDPRQLSESLAVVARSLGLGDTTQLMTVFGDWSGVVGDVLGAHSRPERLRDGELIVIVDEPAWATEFRFHSSSILQRLNATRSTDTVRSIVVQVDRGNRSADSDRDPSPSSFSDGSGRTRKSFRRERPQA
jgi:hypothetical protein